MSHFDLRPWFMCRMEDWVQNGNATYALCDSNLALPSRYQISYPMWMARVCALSNIHIHCIWIKTKNTYQIHNINIIQIISITSISYQTDIISMILDKNINQFNINHSISFSNSGMLSFQILSDRDVSSKIPSDIETSKTCLAIQGTPDEVSQDWNRLGSQWSI